MNHERKDFRSPGGMIKLNIKGKLIMLHPITVTTLKKVQEMSLWSEKTSAIALLEEEKKR